jgi:uncharacterized membrane protein YeaQ/YmgE (transglycosylase-associated protein family)
MNELKALIANPVVTLIVVILIGAVIGWFYEKQVHSPHGYITSALVGVAGSYTGYDLVKMVTLPRFNLTARLIAAAVGAAILLWAWRTYHLSRKSKRR